MDNKIVVGVDFGTTFSAVAWATSAAPDHIELISGWPSNGQYVGLQVPTEISYDEGDTTQFHWGYDLPVGSRKIKWFKLGLEEDDPKIDLPNDLTVSDITRDFLSALYKHAMSALARRFDQNTLQQSKIEFILTVPAIWSDAAKQRTERAAQLAGFTKPLTIVSEPESAALYAMKAHNMYSQVSPGDSLIVCDAGGGTVDLISYKVVSMSPLVVHETAPGDGGFCGSSYIDRRFMELFQRRMGAHYENLSIPHRLQVAKNFEAHKMAFRDDPNRNFYVNVPTVGTIVEAGVSGGHFEITQAEMRSIFDPIVEDVIRLVQQQINVGGTPKSILLVGGFGESEYLFQRLRAWAPCQVIQPIDCSTAIVRGAVMKALETKDVKFVRRARRSYGTPMALAFVPGLHLEKDGYIEKWTGTKMARNQVCWFIRKGDPISDDEIINHSFTRSFKKAQPWHDELLVCSDDRVPNRITTTVKPLCTLTTDLSHLRKSAFKRRWKGWRPYRVALYDLRFDFKGGYINWGLVYNGQRYSTITAEFE